MCIRDSLWVEGTINGENFKRTDPVPVSYTHLDVYKRQPSPSGRGLGRGSFASTAVPPLDYRWWDQATMVIDNSASMAASGKINTVKTIIGEQVSDLAPAPQGTEFNIYTFNAGGSGIVPLVEGKFFAPQIMPAVNGLVANGPDAGCPVPGLGALSQAIQTKFDGEAWLYTCLLYTSRCV